MIHQRLAERDKSGKPFQVGIIGAGTFGTQIIAQTCRMRGMRIAAIAEIAPERAIRALAAGGIGAAQVREASTADDIDRAIAAGQPAVTRSLDALLASEVDVVVEATGNPELGARHGAAAIEHHKHVVMVTVEADVIVGHILKERADAAGVMYSLAYGDEPALAVELCDWGRTLGFRVIAAGKGTRFIPPFRKANPDDVPRLYGFSGKDYNAQVFCSFLDGTKHAIEMAALANAAGLSVDVRGMHFQAIDVRELPNVLCHQRHGGILQSEGVVEAVSALRPDETWVEKHLRGGVYAVLEAPDNQAAESLATYGEIIGMVIGKTSRYVVIYRPQHFVGHEVPIGIARMLLFNDPVAAPVGHTCEVVAAAKKRLAPGTKLDGEGGYCVYGLVERAETALREKLVPIGLLTGAEVLREIPEDGLITFDNVRVPDSFALQMRTESLRE
ncbi:MAG TPA: Gfo/Idh/MocA family oxidoreductase [Planctomycetaceae bacterium]|nr:Gfo/Idh/MocA family oxidoreductase [Planctomycetaceae bacterium]